MSRPVSRVGIIGAIVAKDLKEFTRDRFFAIMTVVGLIFYVAMFWLLPSTVNESITVGVYQIGMDQMFDDISEQEGSGLKFETFKTSKSLRAALGLGEGEPKLELDVGIDFPDDFLQTVAQGEPTTVKVYVDGDIPSEIHLAMSSWVKEIAYTVAGNTLPVTAPDEETIILGEDRAGNQVTFRERIRPFFAFFILMMETMALGTLVAAEISTRTVTAVMVTPARISDFLIAKGLVGTGVAFAEAVLLMALIGSLNSNPLILLTALLLGAAMVTGVGLIAGSSGKDFIGMVFYSMLFLIPLMIPAVAVLFPGSASIWVKAMPSYGLVETIVGVTSYNEGWSEALPNLGMLLGWCIALFVIGWFTLKRKVESL